MGDDVVLDTPGIYGVSSFNDEETVARDIVMEADVILNVVDAVHLERDLFLTQQVIDMGIPVVVALNMVDEATAKGVDIDVEQLSRLLDVPVIPTVAVRREGFDEVREALADARVGRSDPELQERLTELLDRVGTRAPRRCSCSRRTRTSPSAPASASTGSGTPSTRTGGGG